uniref:Cytochrome b5 heme-binding domain-containing protein n=1 Tax=Pseudonaja textilis TaxID=8673 RepID=A0A670XR43_PSETE
MKYLMHCNSDREAWLVIHDCIYVLLEQAGRDATESFEVVGHSMDAKEMLKQYLIGEIHPDGHKPDTSKVPTTNSFYLNGSDVEWQSLLIPACLIKHCQQPLCGQVSYKK